MKQPIMFDDEDELKNYIDEKIIESNKELFIKYIKNTITSSKTLINKDNVTILIDPIFYNLFIKNINYITPIMKFNQLIDEKIINININSKYPFKGFIKITNIKFIITHTIGIEGIKFEWYNRK